MRKFYANAYDPEDSSLKYCRVWGKVIRFDVETLNDFLETLVIITEGEEYPIYFQYLYTYPDHEAIMAKLCTSGDQFILNTGGAPWKQLRKDLTTLAQTWSVLSYFNLVPTSHTFYLNMDLARLIYGLVSQMDMDLGNMILGQIRQIAQSSTFQLGFATLITTLCDVQGFTSNTLTFESLSPMINLTYISVQ